MPTTLQQRGEPIPASGLAPIAGEPVPEEAETARSSKLMPDLGPETVGSPWPGHDESDAPSSVPGESEEHPEFSPVQ